MLTYVFFILKIFIGVTIALAILLALAQVTIEALFKKAPSIRYLIHYLLYFYIYGFITAVLYNMMLNYSNKGLSKTILIIIIVLFFLFFREAQRRRVAGILEGSLSTYNQKEQVFDIKVTMQLCIVAIVVFMFSIWQPKLIPHVYGKIPETVANWIS